MNYVTKLEELVTAHQLALEEMRRTLGPHTDAEADYAEAEAKAYLKYAEEGRAEGEKARTVKHLEMLVARDCAAQFRKKIATAAAFKTATKYAEGLETTISAVQSLMAREKAEIQMQTLPQPQWGQSRTAEQRR